MVILYWLNENVMLHIIPFYPMNKRDILGQTLQQQNMQEQKCTALKRSLKTFMKTSQSSL